MNLLYEIVDINDEFPDLSDNQYIDNIIDKNGISSQTQSFDKNSKKENFLRKFIKPVDSKIKCNNLREYLTKAGNVEKLQV